MILSETPWIELILGDCLDFMVTCKDKQFSLAVVDPPYGINKDGQKKTTGGHGGRKEHKKKSWDSSIPDAKYFSELKRVSHNQIIWGANFYPQYLTGSMGWIFWDKGQDINQSDGELAYTSFDCALRRKVLNRVALLIEGTIHPTQKPVKLYEWLLTNYAKPGDTIFDSHGGSFSSAIAAYRLGFDFTGMELDKSYFEAAVKRFKEQTAQMSMFKEIARPEPKQLTIE